MLYVICILIDVQIIELFQEKFVPLHVESQRITVHCVQY